MKLLAVLVVFPLLLKSTWTLQRGFLYSHGRSVPDQILPPQDDVSSPEIYLRVPIVFFNEIYNSIFVNSNGILSFTAEVSRFYNLQFPLDYPLIAPLYSNVDVRASGSVYYRETQEDIILERATRTISAAFSNAREFRAKSVLIVTWEDVGYHNQGADKVNTYQAAVISDGEDSYVEFLYPDHAIQWVQGASQGGGLPDALAQAGFVAADGRYFTLKGSGSDQVRSLNELSNADNSGQWLFHVGRIGDGNVDEPDNIKQEDENSLFCSAGLHTCHSRAACVDFETGFCCVCQNGYFGNGKNCLSEDIPLRVNGKLSGNINGYALTDYDLQTYIVPADGRTYTAISIVPPTVAYDLQNLNILASTIGWLFARPVKGALNGYQLTGGVFNQTVTVRFPLTGHQFNLNQHFTGLDVFQQLTMTSTLQGSLPSIPIGSKIIIKDYEEQYTRVGLGQFIAESSQVYQLEGVGVDNPYTVEQTVTFEECAGTVPATSTMRLKGGRLSISCNDGIVRFSMTSKVTPLGVDEDPCRDTVARCGSHSTCVVNADSYRCVCNPGYQMGYPEEGSDVSCVDMDECAISSSTCDPHATCTNTQGSFHCQCNPGYTEDGQNCIKVLTCEDARCDPNAECVQRSRSAPQCVCRSGFRGDGTICDPVDDALDTGDHGEQTPPVEGRPQVVNPTCVLITCTCPDGYDIDYSETRCNLRQDYYPPNQLTNEDEDDRSLVDENIDDLQFPEPICISDGICSCPKGYSFLKKTHECFVNSTKPLDTKGPTGQKRSCVHEGFRCHAYATCVMFTKSRTVACECNEGYRGDGQRSCEPVEGYDTRHDECVSPADCVGDADCLEDSNSRRRVCSCYPGFTKNPVTNTCHRSEAEEPPVTCLTADICHPDATCAQDYEGEAFCRCNSGYEGDGNSCRPIESGCNVLYNCAPSTGECLYDEAARGYRCKCRQGYQGDGHVCSLTRTCLDDVSLCGDHASCQLIAGGEYSCQCEEGFVGNGLLCKPASARIGNFLLVGQGMAILRVPFQPTSTDRGRPIVMESTQLAVGIDLDCSENKAFWSDTTGKKIYSSDYTGHNLNTFIGSDIGSAEGISIDWLSRNIFWTDSDRDTVEVASLDDSSIRKTIVATGLVNPRGIAVHPSRGKVFWADWNRDSPKIEWANLDGSGRATFVQGSKVNLPNSLALDFSTDELCWADAKILSIECIGIGNRYERTVASNLSYPFGLTISQDHYYWTDWLSGKIERMTRPGQIKEKSLPPPLGSSGKLYGIVAVSDSCPRLSSICQLDRGRCPEHHLCLLNGNGGRSCVCASPKCQNLGS